MIGHISFSMKLLGKRSAGKPHAAFDEAGDGNRVNFLGINYCAIAQPYRRGDAGK